MVRAVRVIHSGSFDLVRLPLKGRYTKIEITLKTYRAIFVVTCIVVVMVVVVDIVAVVEVVAMSRFVAVLVVVDIVVDVAVVMLVAVVVTDIVSGWVFVTGITHSGRWSQRATGILGG